MKEIAYSQYNPNDGVQYYYVNQENVSYGRYQEYIEGCIPVETELTESNIDKIVK